MKAPKEYKQAVNNIRAKHGKTNGVIPWLFFDDPWFEKTLANSKKNYKRDINDRHNTSIENA